MTSTLVKMMVLIVDEGENAHSPRLRVICLSNARATRAFDHTADIEVCEEGHCGACSLY
jgi:hypothetical protein